MKPYLPIILFSIGCSNSIKTTTVEPEANITYDNDGDGYTSDEDCDDNNPQIHPGASEICDGIDNSCDGEIDEGVQQTFYADTDDDGFGDEGSPKESCEVPIGYVQNGGDCDDSNGNVYPFAQELCDEIDNNCDGSIDEDVGGLYFIDEDEDGFGTGEAQFRCEEESGYSIESGDCNDTNASVYPQAPEICDSLDNNCDGNIDEDGSTTFYLDSDGDGYGTQATSIIDCNPPVGYVAIAGDCNDTDTLVSPAASEICDFIDNNCNGLTDDEDTVVVDELEWYIDYDNDGYGNAAFITYGCVQPSGYVSNADDCNDLQNAISPAATEICDEIDNNCDEQIDENVQITYYIDQDADGYGSSNATTLSCSVPNGYSGTNDDCDDNRSSIFPNNPEICDNLDNNCDGSIDEGLFQNWFLDYDQDGFGDDNFIEYDCEAPSTLYTALGGDCNDLNPLFNPDADLDCTGEDYNCDGLMDNDNDLDGYPDQTCGGTDCDDNNAAIFPARDNECAWGISCDDILSAGLSEGSGLYMIDVDGFGTGYAAEEVYCEMTMYDGGWTLIANNSASDTTLLEADMVANTVFGIPTTGDYKATAWNSLLFSDVMFTDSILYAVYENVGDGGTSWYDFQSTVPLWTCVATMDYEYPMTAGNFNGNLCSTNLYLNPIDHDGGGPASCFPYGQYSSNGYGPTWSTLNNGSVCPLDDPNTNTFWYHDTRLPWSQTADLRMFVR